MLVQLLFGAIVLSSVHAQSTTNVRLVNHRDYMISALQQLIYDVEDKGWSNLEMVNVSIAVNESLAGYNATGNATFFDGFLQSFSSVDVRDDSVQALMLAATATVSATLQLHDVRVAYDVVATMDGDGERRYTGVIGTSLITVGCSVSKRFETQELTSSVRVSAITGGTIRMEFEPQDQISQVLSRVFTISMIWDGVSSWMSRTMDPVFHDVVTNRIPFPKTCYNCPA